MSPKTVIIVGVSGVGKTTFINSLKEHITFQHLSAGSLIQHQKERLAKNVQRDDLRLQGIANNQTLLIDDFQ